MKEQKKWNKGGTSEGEDRVTRIALRKTRAYHRPTKGELYEQIAENVQEYGFDVEQEQPDDFLGLGRQDFINLFMLLDDEPEGRERYAIRRYHTEVAHMTAIERAGYMAELHAAYNERKACAADGEKWPEVEV